MPECTSTGCRRERFAFVAFFRNLYERRLRGVAVDCLTHLGIQTVLHNSTMRVSPDSHRESGQRDYPLPSCMALLADTPGVHPRSALSLGAGLPESPPRASSVRSSSPILRL